ncbi:MAG TPA: TIGR00730 family Rossman fold protein [Acidimicrobiia bacterium]|nr:TIGR00730 family Rossman fold protein [Acidimicrobiia bacterium]
MVDLRRVCVFCGSSPGARPDYREAAVAMGTVLAEEGIGLVYGGGCVGLMGAVADAALAAGGEVIGIIPEHMRSREIAHYGLSDLRVVDSMHERKALMYDLADGFVALPGGLGTLEELFEITTWCQLGLKVKPTGLLDVAGFFTPLVDFLDHVTAEEFVKPVHRRLLVVEDEPKELLGRLRNFEPPPLPRWLLARER